MATLLSSQAYSADCVILLHGLSRSEQSMAKMEQALNENGYQTINLGYPSTKYPIEQLADDAINEALSHCPTDTTVHFVTHSMGGILVRQYLHKASINNLGRVVMLGPPNKGSELVDIFSPFAVFKSLNGPAGVQLGTSTQSIPNRLGAVDFELGIIAGTRNYNPIYSLLLPSPNDGKVSIESSKVKGMTEHIELPVTHTFMMNNKQVIARTLHFLANGGFFKLHHTI